MEIMPIFGMLGSLLGGGGKEDKEPAPAPAAEREKAPQVDAQPESAAMAQKKKVAANRASQAQTGSTSDTRGGVSIVGG